MLFGKRKKRPIAAESEKSAESGDTVRAAETEEENDGAEEYDPWRDITHDKAVRILFFPFCLAVLMILLSLVSRSFAEAYCRTFGSLTRKILAAITGILPFSLAETLFFAGFVLLLYGTVRCIAEAIKKVPYDKRFERRFNRAIIAVVLFCFTFYGLNFAPCNRRTTLADNLGIEREKVSAKQLYNASVFVAGELSDCLEKGDIRYGSSGLSSLPYSFDELSDRVNEAYDKVYDRYSFLTRMHAPVKRVALSGWMTYTHISGIYIPYTGEANINIHYPDYVIAFSTAHEMAHQRGISHEDEANFVAFLVLYQSDDYYLRYSALCELYNYLTDALYSADEELFYSALYKTPRGVLREMMGFSDFFEPYSNSTASKIADTVNSASIKLRGDSEGTKSYDMMVDLAVAYFGIGEE